MRIQSKRELEATRDKLRWLEERVSEIKARPVDNPRARELTIRSFMKMINQMKKEIVRYEAAAIVNAHHP